MKKHLEDKLCRDFPSLYKDPQTVDGLKYWGFECGDGWFDLIYELSRSLGHLPVEAFQVKEKFGGLRFYTKDHNEDAQELIDEAEKKSLKVCEKCGVPGKARTGGWIKTLCDKCYNERNAK